MEEWAGGFRVSVTGFDTSRTLRRLLPICLLVACACRRPPGEEEALYAVSAIGERPQGYKPMEYLHVVPLTPLGRGGYELDAPEAMAWVSEREWIYYLSFSTHSQVKDVVLAVDQDWNIHTTGGHVCPSMHVMSPKGKAIASVSDFFATTTYQTQKEHPWTAHGQGSAALRERVRALVPPRLSTVPETRTEHCRQLVGDATTPRLSRKWALGQLVQEGSPASWKAIEQTALKRTNWDVRSAAIHVLLDRRPARATALRPALLAGLGADSAARTNSLAAGIGAVESREDLHALLWLVEPEDAPLLCEAFEELARSLAGVKLWSMKHWQSTRNYINAYGVLHPGLAARFCRSLLRSEDSVLREIGILAMGELRVADAVPDLRAMSPKDKDDYAYTRALGAALGKIGTRAAHDALIDMLTEEPILPAKARTLVLLMHSICGPHSGSREGMGWTTRPKDRPATADRFAKAIRQVATRTTDEKLAEEALYYATAIGEKAQRRQ